LIIDDVEDRIHSKVMEAYIINYQSYNHQSSIKYVGVERIYP